MLPTEAGESLFELSQQRVNTPKGSHLLILYY